MTNHPAEWSKQLLWASDAGNPAPEAHNNSKAGASPLLSCNVRPCTDQSTGRRLDGLTPEA
jgi:hypothetical protein